MKVTYTLLLLLPAASAPFAYADHDAYDFDGLTVVFIDLETKGDSTLVIFPNEKTTLIDGGLSPAYPNIKEVLQSFDISTVDVVVATHSEGQSNPIIRSSQSGGSPNLMKFEIRPIDTF